MLARSLLGWCGFSCHSTTRSAVVQGQDAHPGRVRERDPSDGDRHVGAVAAMGGHEGLVVHLVDVVAGQDQDRRPSRVLDDVEVLEDRVGGPAVPLRDAAAGDVRLEHPDAAGVAVQIPRPAHADVVVERARVVLGQDDDVVDVRVHAVGEGEVDDPVLAAERHGRLGPHRREDGESLALAAGEYHRHRRLHRVVPSSSSPRRVPGLDASTRDVVVLRGRVTSSTAGSTSGER